MGSVQSVLTKDILARVADLVDGVQHWVHYRWELYIQFHIKKKVIISTRITFSECRQEVQLLFLPCGSYVCACYLVVQFPDVGDLDLCLSWDTSVCQKESERLESIHAINMDYVAFSDVLPYASYQVKNFDSSRNSKQNYSSGTHPGKGSIFSPFLNMTAPPSVETVLSIPLGFP